MFVAVCVAVSVAVSVAVYVAECVAVRVAVYYRDGRGSHCSSLLQVL